MPLYQFRCRAGHITEIQRDPGDSRDAVCDRCGQVAPRLYRIGGIAFKGDGFFNTDNPQRGHVARLRD